MLSTVQLLLLLAIIVFTVIIFPGKYFIQCVKNESGVKKILWIACIILTWPIANFVYALLKAGKLSARILAGTLLALSLVASVYIYRHMDEYMEKLTTLSEQLSGQSIK